MKNKKKISILILFYPVFILLSCKEISKVELVLSSKKEINECLIGKVEKTKSTNNLQFQSASIIANDKIIIIKLNKNNKSANYKGKIKLFYDSKSLVNDFQVGKSYLFAISDAECVGFLEVIGDKLELPDGNMKDIEGYKNELLHQPFPDYYGWEVNSE